MMRGVTNIDGLLTTADSYPRRRLPGLHIDRRPRLGVAVVSCMDARIDLFDLLGLADGDAHLLRNAGGVITDDVIRSLVISQRALGTREILLVHHTDCGLQTVTEDEFKAQLEAETGVRPAWAVEAFTDVHADVRQSLQRIRHCPFFTDEIVAVGTVYDVDTHQLHIVT
jgi:carbonic anhydrase